jgi:hypothetical protein
MTSMTSILFTYRKLLRRDAIFLSLYVCTVPRERIYSIILNSVAIRILLSQTYETHT